MSPDGSTIHRQKIRQIWTKHKKRLGKKHTVEIECPDGSRGLENDDYCDCADGSDEPSTAACSQILVNKASFHCLDGNGAVHSSRVGDGVKDCSDGSDEKRRTLLHHAFGK